ncbi:RluA family pseudouridine synthase [Haloplasma contractile]|uniref:Pseudouridine synthase n=1 Tax=Haloplasma contractile SSD-17B TaxID=1033810 RepID=U2E9P6_9MOLU|nr:RluA family pseudouridine synthase [Haloplasma contractile]ERJ11556.1 Pseudouridine synthase protein [Haloplasma contractile SSD-17B]
MELMYTIKEQDAGKNIKTFLLERNISRKLLISIKHRGGTVLLNEKCVRLVDRLSEQDVLIVKLPDEIPSDNLSPQNLETLGFPLQIVYEDDFLLVINKQHGIACIPNMRYKNLTLANSIMHHYKKINQQTTVHFINRLDKDTSGLLIVAKNRYIHHLMNDKTKIKRKYLAIVEHTIAKNITIEHAIKRDETHPVKRLVVRDEHENGKSATTIVTPKEWYQQHTLVECELLTGRTHQIRVHLSSIGHPLIGDSLYGGGVNYINRQALHSYKLQFKHPITNQLLKFEIPAAHDMKQVILQLEKLQGQVHNTLFQIT